MLRAYQQEMGQHGVCLPKLFQWDSRILGLIINWPTMAIYSFPLDSLKFHCSWWYHWVENGSPASKSSAPGPRSLHYLPHQPIFYLAPSPRPFYIPISQSTPTTLLWQPYLLNMICGRSYPGLQVPGGTGTNQCPPAYPHWTVSLTTLSTMLIPFQTASLFLLQPFIQNAPLPILSPVAVHLFPCFLSLLWRWYLKPRP